MGILISILKTYINSKKTVIMTFLGIDPGLIKTGWAIVKRNGSQLQYIASGIIKTKSNKQSIAYQLIDIFNGISQIISLHEPSYVAIENTYVNENPSSSLKLTQARAAAIIASANSGLIPSEYQASTIKKIVSGKGNADKQEVYKMITLQLGSIICKTHDESDAIAIAMCDALFHKPS
jgi:crossover junction endodeoxyribonuclease RuvC